MNLIIDLQYFTSVNSIFSFFQYTNIYFPLYQTVQKSSFANRCIVAGSNGLINLSVPLLEGRNQKLPFKEIRISNHEKWQMRHWRTIESCYRRAPYFEFYEEPVRKLLDKDHQFLANLDIEIMSWVMKVLKYPGEVHYPSRQTD
ncbi:MAG: hypothetical protein JWN76_3527, partial [Chitinophagaceae bacterium]|nr:hypothetical protein [Chitinophagaceae bacterium]